MAQAVIPNSTTNAVAAFVLVLVQVLLNVVRAVDASRTSHLKASWLTKPKSSGLRLLFQYVPYKTLGLSFIYLCMALTISLCRTFGVLGFTKLPELRKHLIYAYYIQAVFQPLVTLGTVSRMARRLQHRSKDNKKIDAKRTGILEPLTVHGQSLKLHYTDVNQKASLLFVHQMHSLSGRTEGLEEGECPFSTCEAVQRTRKDLTPEDVFSVGVVLPDPELSDFGQFKNLLSKLQTVTGSQMYRLIAQSVLFVGMFILLGVFSEKEWIREKSESITLVKTFCRATVFLSPSVVGGFYEYWAPALANNVGPNYFMSFCWVGMQVWLYTFPFSLLISGNIKKGLIYEEVVLFLTGLACFWEVILSESWIAKAIDEAPAFKVPSWMELSILTGYDPDKEGTELRFK